MMVAVTPLFRRLVLGGAFLAAVLVALLPANPFVPLVIAATDTSTIATRTASMLCSGSMENAPDFVALRFHQMPAATIGFAVRGDARLMKTSAFNPTVFFPLAS